MESAGLFLLLAHAVVGFSSTFRWLNRRARLRKINTFAAQLINITVTATLRARSRTRTAIVVRRRRHVPIVADKQPPFRLR